MAKTFCTLLNIDSRQQSRKHSNSSIFGMPLSNYELKYFNLRTRGEPIRLILHYLQIPFKDTYIDTFTEWANLKNEMPFKQLPVFVDGDFTFSQTIAIMRYLAKKHGLLPKSLKKKTLCDMYAEQIQDHFNALLPFIQSKLRNRDDYKEKFKTIFVPEMTEKFGPNFEHILEKSESGFIVGDTLTWVDFYLADFTDKGITYGSEDLFEKFPKLVAHHKKIFALPPLEEYLKSRPNFPF